MIQAENVAKASATTSNSVTNSLSAVKNDSAQTNVLSVEEEHEKIVATMVSTTGQEKDVCYFYLESANWNLNEAIELMQNMDALK